MSSIKVAVIGFGNMGTAHAACLAEGKIRGLELGAVCDIRPERLEESRRRFPAVPCYGDYRELLAAGAVQAAVVAVPHPLHREIASAALEAGLHTLVEKPIEISVTKARALTAVAQASGKVFAIMLNQRTNPIFRKARDIVQGGQLGELKRTIWIITNWYRTQHYYDSGSWRATWAGEGGGVLLNQAPHNLDLWQWICGMPVSVAARCEVAKYHHIEVEDEATLFTRYANGATGLFITSTGEFPGTNRLEISGELGKLVLEEGKLKWWKLQRNEKEVRFSSDANFAKIDLDYTEFAPQEKETAHAGILQNFANAILEGEPLLSPGEDGINELTLSNAAYLSQWQNSAPVALPLDGEAFDRLLAARAAASVYHGAAQAGEKASGQYSERWQVNW